MNSATDQILADWSPPWPLTAAVLLTAAVYTVGFVAIRRTRPAKFPEWRLASFLLGLLTLWLALASPIDGFADALLSAHMVQHLLLMSAVPPLLLLGAPVVPLLRGVPRVFTRLVVGPFLRSRTLRKLGHFITRPVVAWMAMNLSFLLWHVPAAYDYALWHESWHQVEHACFLFTSLLFWYPVIQPWPARAHDLGWGILLYLITADLANTVLSAFLAFCERPVYVYYLVEPNPFHIDPVTDQRLGAVIMWVLGSMVFLVPAMMLTVKLLQGSGAATRRRSRQLV